VATIPARLRAAFVEHRARVALRDGGASVTYEELDARSEAVARLLRERRLPDESFVAVLMPSSVHAAAAYIGIWKAGHMPVLVNPALARPELAYIFGHCRPHAFVVTADRLALARSAETDASAGAAAGSSSGLWLTDAPADGAIDLTGLEVTLGGGGAEIDRRDGTSVALLMYTSGTTGRPKGVLLTHAGILAIIDRWRDRMRWNEDDVVMCVLPLFHIYAHASLFLASLLTGARVVLERMFTIPAFVGRLAHERATVFSAVPPMLQALDAASWSASDYDLGALRLITTSGAPAPLEMQRRLEAKFPRAPIYEGYGITETSACCTIGPLDEEHVVGSCGKPIPDVHVRICDEVGRDVPPMEAGEIWIRTPGLMKGYYRDDDATAAAVVAGYFRSGDIGHLDGDGRLYVTDRIKDVIFVGGDKVVPREVEEAILRYPSVARAAVVRMDHPATGEAPLAYVVVREGATLEVAPLIAFLRDQLAPYKVPRKVQVVTEIPTTASGKIQRYKLRTQ